MGDGECWHRAYYFIEPRRGLTDMLTFVQSPEESEGRSCVGISMKSIQGGGKSWCKGPETGVCPACLGNSRRLVGWSEVN